MEKCLADRRKTLVIGRAGRFALLDIGLARGEGRTAAARLPASHGALVNGFGWRRARRRSSLGGRFPPAKHRPEIAGRQTRPEVRLSPRNWERRMPRATKPGDRSRCPRRLIRASPFWALDR